MIKNNLKFHDIFKLHYSIQGIASGWPDMS